MVARHAALGPSHSLLVTSSGAMLAAGSNSDGQLGLNVRAIIETLTDVIFTFIIDSSSKIFYDFLSISIFVLSFVTLVSLLFSFDILCFLEDQFDLIAFISCN